MNNQKKWFTKVLFTQEQIEAKCAQLAKWVNREYKDSQDFVIIGLLKGSIPFMAQLIKSVDVNHVIDFMTVSTFDGGVKSSGNVKVIMDLKREIKGKDVLIVEDIVDTGITLAWVYKQLKARKPKSLKILTLMDKPEGRKNKINVDKVGFKVPHAFLAGFGLDVKEKLRNVPFIGIFDISKIDDL